MKLRSFAIPFSIGVLTLVGCTQGLGTTGVTGTTLDGSLRPLATVSTPSLTHTPAATPTPTISPTVTITPTPTPPPDLELTDVTIYPETFNNVNQTYYLMARIRNNTDKIMVFHEKEKVFDFTFEFWQHDSSYYHSKINETVQMNVRGSGYDENMNCILYPGDEGIFYHRTNSISDEYIIDETLNEYTGPLGLWFTYVSYYHTRTDVPMNAHFKAENIAFVNEIFSLSIDFDLEIPEPMDRGHYTFINSWIILYDKDNKIINILQTFLSHTRGVKYGERFHFHSRTDFGQGAPVYMHPVFEVTAEMRERVDHIEVFNELEEDAFCADFNA